LEYQKIHGKTHVAIYDGRAFATSLRRKVEASELDPRVVLRAAYGLIPDSKYLGTVSIRNSKCWHYSRKEGSEELQLWIDTERQVPRKLSMKFEDDEIISEEYLDLPADIAVSPDLFDITNLPVRILNHIRADFTD
jgi:outer membrane lipoprotein-sorting protein